MRTKRSERPMIRVFCYALLLAAAALFFCSKSSPAYPINDWSDANIYLTAGRGMLNGRVMYRDLYDHKGPLLYALHALCALLAPGGFTAVYALETLCAAAFVTVAYRLAALYGGERAAPVMLPALLTAVYASYSFQQGDSAEELCLPLMLYTVYSLLKRVKAGAGNPAPKGDMLVNGALTGCVFWMKFTLCGAQAAALALWLCFAGARGGARSALRALGWLAAGFALSTLPWLMYFGLNGAIVPWLKTYLYDNLFLYASGEEGMSLLTRLKLATRSAVAWGLENPLYAVPTLAGLAACTLGKQATRWERAAWGLPFLGCALGVFITGRTYPYYALALAAFAPAALPAPCAWLAPRLAKARARRALIASACVLCVALCPALSQNVRASFLQKREDTMQYRFAAIIRQTPNPTLLNYGFMDAGFYTAANVAPSVKYYHQTNVPLPEMLREQERYITDGVCDYVVTRGRQPEDITQHYRLIATAETPEGYWYERVYLYRRKGL